jgi:Tol biopolymer transport system component
LSGRIAYNSQSYIWTMRSDGSDPRRWALPGCWCTGAAISADGMRVAWWQQGIVWMYADSTRFERLTGREAADTRPAWSPDGRRLAYVEVAYGPPDTMDVFVVNADGSGRQRITRDSTYTADPAWSPDGSRIAYAGKGSPTAFPLHIWLINADGTGRVQLTTRGEHHVAPAWSPDGLHIAYSSNGNTGNPEIWIMNADGSNPRQITSIGGREPTWSPDGTRIAFRSVRDGPSEIYVMNRDGTGVTKLIANAVPGTDDAYPFWGP